MHVVLCQLDPACAGAQKRSYVPYVRWPSISFEPRRNESRVHEVVGLQLEDFWIVQSVIQIVADKLQVFRLVRQMHRENIEASYLCSHKSARVSARNSTRLVFLTTGTHLTILVFFRELDTPIPATVAKV